MILQIPFRGYQVNFLTRLLHDSCYSNNTLLHFPLLFYYDAIQEKLKRDVIFFSRRRKKQSPRCNHRIGGGRKKEEEEKLPFFFSISISINLQLNKYVTLAHFQPIQRSTAINCDTIRGFEIRRSSNPGRRKFTNI